VTMNDISMLEFPLGMLIMQQLALTLQLAHSCCSCKSQLIMQIARAPAGAVPCIYLMHPIALLRPSRPPNILKLRH